MDGHLMAEPIQDSPHNTATLDMPEETFRALPAAALSVLIAAGAQHWGFRQRNPGEAWQYIIRIYLAPAAMARLLAVVRPMLEAAK
jgi:hypothetical protein